MTTHSGLDGALTSLLAQRQALEIASHSGRGADPRAISRHRAHLRVVGTEPVLVGEGEPAATALASVAGLGRRFLEARVREGSVTSGYLSAVAEAWEAVETTLDEPGEAGLGARLTAFFDAWNDLAAAPADQAVRAGLLAVAADLVARIAAAHHGVSVSWRSLREQAASLETEVNAATDAVAALNARIAAQDTPPTELVEERRVLLTRLAALVGAEPRIRPDAGIDVWAGGGLLVDGDLAIHVAVQGSPTLEALTSWVPDSHAGSTTGPVRLVWAANSAPLEATGGRLGGLVTALAPAANPGLGGPLATIAASYDDLARELTTTVNEVYAGGVPPTGDAGPSEFFVLPAQARAGVAAGLAVAVAEPDRIRTAAPGRGALDASVATTIAELGGELSTSWSLIVATIGVQTRTASQRAVAAQATLEVAEGLLASDADTDLDDETLRLIAGQQAYEGAARVIAAIHQLLDTLIIRTGVPRR